MDSGLGVGLIFMIPAVIPPCWLFDCTLMELGPLGGTVDFLPDRGLGAWIFLSASGALDPDFALEGLMMISRPDCNTVARGESATESGEGAEGTWVWGLRKKKMIPTTIPTIDAMEPQKETRDQKPSRRYRSRMVQRDPIRTSHGAPNHRWRIALFAKCPAAGR